MHAGNPVSVSSFQRLRHQNQNQNLHRAKSVMSMTLAVIMAAYFLFPLYWLTIASMKSGSDLYGSPSLLPPSHMSWLNNLQILSSFDNGIFWRWFLNSLFYSGTIGVCGTFLSALAAYALAKYTFRFRVTMQRLVVGGLAIPYTSFVIPVFLTVRYLGIMNTYAAVILPMLSNPFGVYFLTEYIRAAVPTDLLEAARVDGVGEFRIFWNIALPIMLPGLVTLFIITFVASWNNFNLPLVVLNSASLFPVTVGLTVMGGGGMDIIGSLVSILPMLILFPFLRRYITSGIMLGGLSA